MLNGIEIDMLSLGDADCIVVTKYENSVPYRIIIDGGIGCGVRGTQASDSTTH